METHADEWNRLAALARLADRTKVYGRSLERGEFPDDLRLDLYRDAMGLSD